MSSQASIYFIRWKHPGFPDKNYFFGDELAYTRGDFWKTYAKLYWPATQDVQLGEFGSQLASQLPPTNDDPSSCPIRVLALGLGIGAFELPILKRLKKVTGRPIHLYGIDSSPEALTLASKLLANGLDNIPVDSKDCLQRMIESPNPKLISFDFRSPGPPFGFPADKDIFALILDDLDYEPECDVNNSPLRRPSSWNRRLATTMNPNDDFDLVISSFCLLHLDWWRATLIRALQLTKPQGVFIHNTVNGDESIFEGRPGVPDNNFSRTARILFGQFFGDQKVRQWLNKPRTLSATRPYDVNRFLERLTNAGLLLPRRTSAIDISSDYHLQPALKKSDYLQLLESRGFSTFKFVEDYIGTSEYDNIVAGLRTSTAISVEEVDVLRIGVLWDTYSLSTKLTAVSTLFWHRFVSDGDLPPLPPNAGKEKALMQSYYRDYEINRASSFDTSNEAAPSNETQDAERIARPVITQGILHSDCIGGEFAAITFPKMDISWHVFTNPLALTPSDQLKVLTLFHSYLSLLRLPDSPFRGFSNSRALVEKLIPAAKRPCVLTYLWEENHQGSVVRFLEHSGFSEIQFFVPQPSPAARTRFPWELFNNVQAHFATPTSFTSSLVDANKLPNLDLSPIVPASDAKSYKAHLLDDLLRAKQSGEVEPDLLHSVKELISDNDSLAMTILLLGHWQHVGQLCIFPVVHPYVDRPFSENAVVFLYRRGLESFETETEYHKANAIYTRALRRDPPFFPEDPFISGLLEMLSHRTKRWQDQDITTTSWVHSEFKHVYGAPNKLLFVDWLGVPVNSKVAKALMECSVPIKDIEIKNVWSKPIKTLDANLLRIIMETLGINLLCESVECPKHNVKLPEQPGLPFLVSLRYFLYLLAQEGRAESVVWSQEDQQSKILERVTIKLARKRVVGGIEEDVESRGLENKYNKEKQTTILKGTSRALDDLFLCRLSELTDTSPIGLLFSGRGIKEKPTNFEGARKLEFNDWSVSMVWTWSKS